jgi:hypothetical protein
VTFQPPKGCCQIWPPKQSTMIASHDPWSFRKLCSPGHDWRPTPGFGGSRSFPAFNCARHKWQAVHPVGQRRVSPMLLQKHDSRSHTRPGVGDGVSPNLDNSESVRARVGGGWPNVLGISSNDFRLSGPARPHPRPRLRRCSPGKHVSELRENYSHKDVLRKAPLSRFSCSRSWSA